MNDLKVDHSPGAQKKQLFAVSIFSKKQPGIMNM